MLYRDIETGAAVRLLAHGTDTTPGRGAPLVAIYCPADNEHTVHVRALDEFEASFVPLPAGELLI